jgi:fatty-acyl-CoA synthase
MGDFGIGSWIGRRARIDPARTALVFEDRSWSYAELDRRIASLTAALIQLGVEPGDRVAYVGPNHPSFLETLFAVARAGAVLVPVNPGLDDEVAAFEMQDAGCRLVIHAPGPPGIGLAEGERVSLDGSHGGRAYEHLIQGSVRPPERTVGLEDLAILPYTSGTTGRPKGVMLTHANLTWNVVNMIGIADITGADVALATAPLFRMGGLGVTVLETLFMGGTVVLTAGPDPDAVLDLIERHRITLVFAGPEILRGLPQHPRWERADLSSVRLCMTGGTTVPEPLIRTYLERGLPLSQGYGLTEASPVVSVLSGDLLRTVGSAGPPVPLCDVRVVDGDRAEVPAGSIGEILVRGPNVMQGYWHRPEATAHALIADGWLRTGDAGSLDEEGFLYVVGRMADAFAWMGRTVHPYEIEKVLLEHPDVAECAAVGVPDQGTGQVAAAGVVLRAGSNADAGDLARFGREHLNEPGLLGSVVLLDRIPRNPVGKVVRAELRERLTAAV